MHILFQVLISAIFSINTISNIEYISPIDEMDFKTLSGHQLDNTIIYNHFNQHIQKSTIFIVKNNYVNRLGYYSLILPGEVVEIDTGPSYFSIMGNVVSFHEVLFDMKYIETKDNYEISEQDVIDYCRANTISEFSYDINEKIINIGNQKVYTVLQKLYQDTPDPMEVDPEEFIICFDGKDSYIRKLSFGGWSSSDELDLILKNFLLYVK